VLTRISLCLFLFWHTALAQQSPPPSTAPAGVQLAQDSSLLLEYAKFLRLEDTSHREYLEKLYAITTGVLCLLVGIGIAVISFFHLKNKRAVQEAVDAEFSKNVEKEVGMTIKQFRTDLDQFDKGQQNLNLAFQAIQTALKANLTRYEHEYLRRLAYSTSFPSEIEDGEYHELEDKHHFSQDVYSRLKRLYDLGFIRPTTIDGRSNIERILKEHAKDETLSGERPRFKLRDYAEITEDGQKFLQAMEQLNRMATRINPNTTSLPETPLVTKVGFVEATLKKA
jgi:hypothetical protein